MNKIKRKWITGSMLMLILLLLVFAFASRYLPRAGDLLHWGSGSKQSGPFLMAAPGDSSRSPGMIYKKVDFSELPPGINNDRRIRQFLGTKVGKQVVDPGRNANDSTVVLDGDTVWQVIINPFPARTSGCSWYAEMQLNGRDDTDDTLTYGIFTYYMKMSSNWDWANGGKMIGLAGKDADGHYPPGGGVTGPSCDAPTDYEMDDGFSVRGGFDFEDKWRSPGGEVGFYVYHQGFQYNECRVHYGDTWNSRRTHGVDMTWQSDKWYKISHRIKLNTPGIDDGFLEWYRNDTCFVAVNNVNFRVYDFIRLDYFMLETFQGGDKVPGYEGATVWYDDLVLWSDHDRSFHDLGYVMTYTPEMSVPGAEQ